MAQGRVPARLALHFSEKIPRKAEDVDEMEYLPFFLVPSTKLNIVDAFFFVWRICTPFIQLFCKTDFRWYLRVTQNKLSKNWWTICNFLIHGSVGLDVPLPNSLYLLLCSLWHYGKYHWFDESIQIWWKCIHLMKVYHGDENWSI